MPTYTTHYLIPKPLVNDPQDEDLWGNELNDGMDIIDSAIFAAASASGIGVASGTVLDYAGNTAPTGYLLCYGQAINRVTFASLFTAIGTVYGAGDGSTTFNIPDARGRVGAGKDDMGGSAANRLTNLAGGVDGSTLGAGGGLQTHTLTTAQLSTHTHAGSTATGGAHVHDLNAINSVAGTPGPGPIFSTVSFAAPSSSSAPDSNGAFSGTNNPEIIIPLSTIFPGKTMNVMDPTSGTHSHTVTVGNAGSGDAHNNVQPTIIFNKIIKT